MLQCPVCGENFRGRADKKFCSSHCRTSYHNQLNSQSVNFVRNINNLLRKNRRILIHFNPKGKSLVKKKDLIKRGFNFNYFTNEYNTKQGKTYRFCYEQGYLELDQETLALVHRLEYVD